MARKPRWGSCHHCTPVLSFITTTVSTTRLLVRRARRSTVGAVGTCTTTPVSLVISDARPQRAWAAVQSAHYMLLHEQTVHITSYQIWGRVSVLVEVVVVVVVAEPLCTGGDAERVPPSVDCEDSGITDYTPPVVATN